MTREYAILSSKDNLVNEIIDFFTAKEVNLLLFETIKDICIRYSNKYNKFNGELYIKKGLLSGFDFLMYMLDQKKAGDGIPTNFVDLTLQQLAKHYIIIPMDSLVFKSEEQRYNTNGELTKSLYDHNLIKNLLYGFNYIIERYKNSVVKIIHINRHGDSSIGTGFFISAKVNNNCLVITNKHVVEGAQKVKIFSADDKEIKINKITQDNDRDIAIIETEQFTCNTFFLSDHLEVMKEIITIGYPTIPTTKYAYQVYHKGEVNSFVEDYWNNKFFLISAKTSSGNSGSPIIDNTGMVVGIITEELFEQDKFYEKGKLPYYAGIPCTEIVESIKKFKTNCS